MPNPSFVLHAIRLSNIYTCWGDMNLCMGTIGRTDASLAERWIYYSCLFALTWTPYNNKISQGDWFCLVHTSLTSLIIMRFPKVIHSFLSILSRPPPPVIMRFPKVNLSFWFTLSWPLWWLWDFQRWFILSCSYFPDLPLILMRAPKVIHSFSFILTWPPPSDNNEIAVVNSFFFFLVYTYLTTLMIMRFLHVIHSFLFIVTFPINDNEISQGDSFFLVHTNLPLSLMIMRFPKMIYSFFILTWTPWW